jgi:hypothetical protein
MFDRDTGTRVGRRLYLGWDVGGWLGKTDGLAAYVFGHSGSLLRAIPGRTVSLWKEFEGRKWTLEKFIRLLDPQLNLDRFDRVVLAIDAPLGMPQRFVRAVTSEIAKVPEPEYNVEKLAESRLAFRVTDRLIAKRFDVKPLSPSLDRATNNGSKARAACAEFIRELPKMAVPPFRKDEPGVTRFVAIEVNPDVWWSEKWINFSSQCIPEAERRGDARDAATCALNALWYDIAVSGIPSKRFPLLPPVDPVATPAPEIVAKILRPESYGEYEPEETPGDRDAIQQEGWIYAPDLERIATPLPGNATGSVIATP